MVLTDSMVPHRGQVAARADWGSIRGGSSTRTELLLGSTPVTVPRTTRPATVPEATVATTSELIRVDPFWCLAAASIERHFPPRRKVIGDEIAMAVPARDSPVQSMS